MAIPGADSKTPRRPAFPHGPEPPSLVPMYRQLLPISALLLGSALLLFAGGINSLILPVRGSEEGFSTAALGFLGTGWASGYVLGCLFIPRLVASVGHIRTFGVMCAVASIAILSQALVVEAWAWIPVRAISGFSFAGSAMIVESWLNDRAEPTTRGRIFGIYSMVNLAASTAGQMVIALGDTSGFLFFALGAIFYSLALIPTAISTSQTPAPLTTVRLDLRALWQNSPVAVMAVFLVGISNSAFGTLSAVYADRVGLDLSSIALFASLPVLAGAIAGPLIAGWVMGPLGPRGLFLTTIAGHIVMIVFTLWRISRRAAVAEADKGDFQASLPARIATPETVVLQEGEDADAPLAPQTRGESELDLS